MTGKPSYHANEIQFALELMLQDLFNDEISQAFNGRFGRSLTDNQIRYLRNKYGKDPDYGAPLVNRPASKKLKRRRAPVSPLPEASRRDKRARRTVSTATASATPAEVAPSSSVPAPQVKVLREEQPSPSEIAEASLLKKEVVDSPTLDQTYVLSPSAPTIKLPLTPQAQPRAFIPRNLAAVFQQQQQQQQQQKIAWNTNFGPINTNFGQPWVKSPAEESTGCSSTPTPNVLSPVQQPSFFPQSPHGLHYCSQSIRQHHQPPLMQPVGVQVVAGSQAGV
ncbi:hypothetical protein ACHAPT_000214 [Fusarium lateritium]